MEKKIVIYGVGKRCNKLIGAICNDNIEIIAFIDANPEKVGLVFCGKKIEPVTALEKYNDEKICITVADWRTYVAIEKRLLFEYGFKKDNIVLYNSIFFESLIQDKKFKSEIVKGFQNNNKGDLPVYFGLIGGLILGGIEERVKQLCSAMIMNGREDVYIVSNNNTDNFDLDETLKDKIVKTNIDYEEKKQTVKSLVRVLISKCPCIVISNQPDEFLMAAYYIKKMKPDDIIIISIISGSTDFIYEQYLRLPMHSDLYIGVSEGIKNDFINRGIMNVISMKVPFPCDKNLKRTYSLDNGSPLKIGYAGRLDGFENSQKRMDILLKVIDEIYNMGIPFCFEIAGEGIAEEKMREHFLLKGLDKYIIFLGRIPKNEIKNFWKRQDIGINVADYEGRSISIAEMMGGGAVPIVTDTSGVREDIIDGVNGYIVPLGDYLLVAKRIHYLFKNRKKMECMGRRAHEDIWPKSRMDNHVAFWNNILNNDINEKDF